MNDYKKARDEAAEKWSQKTRENLDGTPFIDPVAVLDFKAGHDHCLQSEVVKGLVEALESMYDHDVDESMLPYTKARMPLESYAQAMKEIEE